MATTVATTSAQILSQLIAAGPNDIILVAPGTYSSVTRQTLLVKTNVVIRAQNIDNRPLIQDSGFRFNFVKGVTIDNIQFRGTAIESTKNGVQYPASNGPRIDDCEDITFINCSFDFYYRIAQHNRNRNVRYLRCEFTRCGLDPISAYVTQRGFEVSYCVFKDDRIDRSRQKEGPRHPDPIQFACNNRDAPSEDVTISYNLMIGGSDGQTGKGPFFGNSRSRVLSTLADLPEVGYKRIRIIGNEIYGGRTHGIFLEASEDSEISGNLLRRAAPNPMELPRISIYGRHRNLRVTNNVLVAGILYNNGATAADLTLSNNVVSNTAVPTGWSPLIDGVNVGPNTGGDPVTPTAPTRPTNTSAGQFETAAVDAAPAFPGRWTGVLAIPSGSFAFAAAADPTRFRWLRPGVSLPKPFIAANPPLSATGARRLQMQSGPGGNPDISTVAGGETLSGLTWQWQGANGAWSELSSFTANVVASDTPLPPDPGLAALTAGQWSIVGPQRLAGRRYTARVKLEAGAPAVTGLQWDKNDNVWRNARADGSEYVLEPLQEGGFDHSVNYAQTLPIRLRYFVAAQPSPASATIKTFTAPAAPIRPAAIADSTRLAFGAVPLILNGQLVSVAKRARPDVVRTEEETVLAEVIGNTIRLVLPSSPPIGAAFMQVIYNGRAYKVNEEETFIPYNPLVRTGLVRGIAADGTTGLERLFRVIAA